MDAYLSKPIQREGLIETVERLAERPDRKFPISNSQPPISDLQISNGRPHPAARNATS